jgi:taurine dioxygenase
MLSSKPFEGKPGKASRTVRTGIPTDRTGSGPTSYTLLHAQEMPAVGGNTMFANQYMSYNSLSPKLRSFVDDLSAIHLQTRKASAVMAEQFPAVIHPLARMHPETKQKRSTSANMCAVSWT